MIQDPGMVSLVAGAVAAMNDGGFVGRVAPPEWCRTGTGGEVGVARSLNASGGISHGELLARCSLNPVQIGR